MAVKKKSKNKRQIILGGSFLYFRSPSAYCVGISFGHFLSSLTFYRILGPGASTRFVLVSLFLSSIIISQFGFPTIFWAKLLATDILITSHTNDLTPALFALCTNFLLFPFLFPFYFLLFPFTSLSFLLFVFLFP